MSLGVAQALGVALALFAAFNFALQYLCVRLGTVRGSVHDVVFVSLLTNVAIVVPVAGAVHGVPEMSLVSVVWFLLAGLSGSLFARLAMFKSVEVIGASRTSPVVSANVFFATILAVIIFGETLTSLHALGIVIIVIGVVVISWETAQDAASDDSLRDLGVSLILPLLAALFLGIEPILISLGLAAGSPVLPGVGLAAIAASIGFGTYLLGTGQLRRATFRWSQEMVWYLGAGVTSALGIISLYTGLALTEVVVVIPLVQTAPLFVVVLSAFFLPQRLERITWRLVAGAVVVVLGVGIVAVQ